MSIANVTTGHTFDEWRTITNQIIVQSGQAHDVAVASFNSSNVVVGTAANLTANLIVANSSYMNSIVTFVVQQGNVANQVIANTMITDQIYANANGVANTFFVEAVLVFPQANTARDHANAAYDQANTAYATANSGGEALTTSQSAFLTANLGYAQANSAATTASGAMTQATAGRDQANTATSSASAAQTQATTARTHANAAFATANAAGSAAGTARDHANAAFAKANTGGSTITLKTDSVDATRYMLFTNATSGNASTMNVSTDLTFNPSTGTLSATIFNSTSDEAKKENIRVITEAMLKVRGLRGVQFNFIESGQPSAGVIAQDLLKVMPELVGEDMSVTYSGIIGLLIEVVKELEDRIITLEQK